MSPADATPTAVEQPRVVGDVELPPRYEQVEQIGRGGMGTVHRAHDRTLDRLVALKVMQVLDTRLLASLLAEAKAMARLSHPNVVHVYDVLTAGDGAIIVMELVQGQTLRQWIDESSPSTSSLLETFAGAGTGLEAAHRAGLVHLDFKPSNVLLGDDGIPKVTDFGLARTTDLDASETRDPMSSTPLEGGLTSWGLHPTLDGVVAGTPRYMSPEQHRGEPCDRTTDVYAFCVSLWEALTGVAPFPEASVEELQIAKERGAPRWTGPPLARRLEAMIRSGLAPARGARPQTLEPILRLLRSARRGDGNASRMWLAGVSLAALAAGIVVWPSGPEPSSKPPPLEGFGTDSPFGERGSICAVTRLDDAGEGTLRACLNRHDKSDIPTRVVFDIGGTIQLASALRIRTPHITLDGLTAPAPGITLASGEDASMGLLITDDPERQTCAHDVLLQGLRFLGTWDGTQHHVEQRSMLELDASRLRDCMRHIVLNRITVIAAPDAAGDMIGNVQDVTVQYSAFLRSHHPMEITNRPGEMLLHQRISLHHNVFAYFHERSPQLRGNVQDVDLIQNVFMNWKAYDFGGGYAIRMRCRAGRCPQRINVIGNHWVAGSGDGLHALVFGKAPEQDADDGPIAQSVFMSGNLVPAANANFGLAPERFVRPEIASVTAAAPGTAASETLRWVGVPYRSDVEDAIFGEVRARVAPAAVARGPARAGRSDGAR